MKTSVRYMICILGLLICFSSIARVTRLSWRDADGVTHPIASQGVQLTPNGTSPTIPVNITFPAQSWGLQNNAGLVSADPFAEELKEYARQTSLPTLSMGPLILDQVLTTLYSNVPFEGGYLFGGVLDITGNLLLFGRRAQAALQSLDFTVSGGTGVGDPFLVSVQQFTLGITFPEGQRQLEIVPGRTGEVTAASVRFDSNGSTTLTITTTIDGTPYTFSGSLAAGDQPDFVMSSPVSRTLSTLIPQTQGTIFDTFVVNGFYKFYSNKGTQIEGLLSGATPGSPAVATPIPNQPITFTNFTQRYSDAGNVYSMDATFLTLPITCKGIVDDVGNTTTALITLGDQPLTSLLPELAGSDLDQITVGASIRVSTVDGIMLCGRATSTITTLFDVELNRLSISLDLGNRKGILSGNMTVLGIPLAGLVSVDWNAAPVATFSIEIPTLRDIKWRPFASISGDIPGLSELSKIEIYDLRASMEGEFQARSLGDAVVLPIVKKIYTDVIKKKFAVPILQTLEKTINTALGLESSNKSPFEKPLTPAKQPEPSPTDTVAQFVHNIMQSDAVKSITTAQFWVCVGGKAKIYNGIVGDLALQVGGSIQSGIGLMVSASLPNGVSLPDLFPFLTETSSIFSDAITLLKLGTTRFVLSTIQTAIGNMPIYPGFNFMSGIVIDDTNNIINKVLGQYVLQTGTDPAGLVMYGTIDPLSPRNAMFKVGLSSGALGFNIGSPTWPMRFQGAGLNIVLRGEPSIGLGGTFTFIPEPNATPLIYSANFMFSTVACGIDGSMLNMWNNPFGVPGISFGNLGLKATQTYENIIAMFADFGISALIPGTIGLAGDVKLGTHSQIDGHCAVALGADISNIAIDIDIHNPPDLINTIVFILEETGVDPSTLEPLRHFIPFRVRQMQLKFVPIDMLIGDITVPRGMGGTLAVDVFGEELSGGFILDSGGIEIKGKIPRVVIGGIFEMTSFDGLAGPNAHLLLHLVKGINLTLDGRLKLGNVFDIATIVQVGTAGLRFEFDEMLGIPGAQIQTHIIGTSISFTDPTTLTKLLRPEDLTLSFEFRNDLNQAIKDGVNAALRQGQDKFKSDMNAIIEQVARNTALADIIVQEAAVAEANARRVSFWNIEWLIREIAYWIEVAKLVALQVKYAFEQTPFGQFARQALDALGLTPLFTNALRVVTDIGAFIFQQGQIVFNDFTDITTLVYVQAARWSGSLANAINLEIPTLDLTLSLAGTLGHYYIGPLKLADPISSIPAVASQLAVIAFDTVRAMITPLRAIPQQRLDAAMRAHPALRYFKPNWETGTYEVDPRMTEELPAVLEEHDRLMRQECDGFDGAGVGRGEIPGLEMPPFADMQSDYLAEILGTFLLAQRPAMKGMQELLGNKEFNKAAFDGGMQFMDRFSKSVSIDTLLASAPQNMIEREQQLSARLCIGNGELCMRNGCFDLTAAVGLKVRKSMQWMLKLRPLAAQRVKRAMVDLLESIYNHKLVEMQGHAAV
ncbi:MAG: hypothetical protein UV38_C0002G0290 [candidate division TM6 bacterium GW2011_GWE2_42_60]|nr:MAG: hypothetical protein UV38_C0002G0290 [candidate division TM6 bacterium GW2011_GWE2_42_60]HBY05958.1 hypothetical protein [Candidatus Dependentiae bacterium]